MFYGLIVFFQKMIFFPKLGEEGMTFPTGITESVIRSPTFS